MHINSLGSADAILALVNAGANVEADDKDGLTGKYRGQFNLALKDTLNIRPFEVCKICPNFVKYF